MPAPRYRLTGNVDRVVRGNALVNVPGELDVLVSGSGDLKYIGSPAVDSRVTGSGNVSQR